MGLERFIPDPDEKAALAAALAEMESNFKPKTSEQFETQIDGHTITISPDEGSGKLNVTVDTDVYEVSVHSDETVTIQTLTQRTDLEENSAIHKPLIKAAITEYNSRYLQ